MNRESHTSTSQVFYDANDYLMPRTPLQLHKM